MKVNFHYDIEGFRIRGTKEIKSIARRIIKDAGKKGGKVDVIFTTDEKLLDINKEFLSHDYYTDIITFDYCEGREVYGEIYISIERVRENARDLSATFQREAKRVIFHGFLHLCGYMDNSEKEKVKMKEMEELYLDISG